MSAQVPTAPRNVTLSGISQTSMMVTWEEPTQPNGILWSYSVSTFSFKHSWWAVLIDVCTLALCGKSLHSSCNYAYADSQMELSTQKRHLDLTKSSLFASVGMHSRHLHNALADIGVQLASHIVELL